MIFTFIGYLLGEQVCLFNGVILSQSPYALKRYAMNCKKRVANGILLGLAAGEVGRTAKSAHSCPE